MKTSYIAHNRCGIMNTVKLQHGVSCRYTGTWNMKITKKVKIVLFFIWCFTIFVMFVGTIFVGKRYIEATFGEGYSVASVYIGESPVKKIYSRISEYKETLAAVINDTPEKFMNDDFIKELNKSLKGTNTHVIVKRNGEYICADDVPDFKKLKKEFDSFENSGYEKVFSDYVIHDTSTYQCSQIHYTYNGNNIAVYILTAYGDYMVQFRYAIVTFLLITLLVVILVGGLVSGLVYVEFVKPIVSLKEAAEAIGEGNLNTKVEYDKHRTDEIGELCRSFTDMENKLSESVELKIQYEKENRELISNISHDLKTPITTIKGYVEGIMDGVADTPEKRDRYLRMIYNKANEMDVLINELSLYANINNNAIPYEFHRVNVKAYFSDCMEEIQTTLATNNMMLKYKDYVDPDVKVVVDPDQLKRVINNIITNAIKYSDKENGLVEIYLYDEGDTIKVSISDDGKGIDEESLPHIFDRTFRADSARQSRGGSGLGLAICKKIIEEHGGKIWAKSKLGVGTTIMFELNKYTKGDEANEQSSDN